MRYHHPIRLLLLAPLLMVACAGGSSTEATPAHDQILQASVPATATPAPGPGETAAVPAGALAGTVAGAPFAARDAVWVALSGSGDSHEQAVLLVVSDQPGLCAALGAGKTDGQAIVAQLGTGQAGALPGVGVYDVAAAGSKAAPTTPYAILGFAGANGQTPLATAGAVAVTAIDAADMGALAATVDGHDAAGNAVAGTVTATYCAAASKILDDVRPGTTNTNVNIGSGNINNNDNNNNGAGPGTGTGTGMIGGQVPVVINININIGNGNVNNNNNNNNFGSGSPNNNNNNDNAGAGRRPGLLGLLGL